MDELEKLIPFWKELKSNEQAFLKKNTTAMHIRAGEMIYNTAMDCLGVMFVRQGQLRVYMVSEEGKQITLYRILSHDICLFSASCAMKNIDFEVQIAAGEETDVLVIPVPVYRELMQTSVPVLRYMYSTMAARFSDVMWVLDQVLNKNMDSRVGALLLEKADLAGTDELFVTHDELSGELGTAREVVTRILKYLQAEGMVKLSRGHITIVDEKGLEKLAKESIR